MGDSRRLRIEGWFRVNHSGCYDSTPSFTNDETTRTWNERTTTDWQDQGSDEGWIRRSNESKLALACIKEGFDLGNRHQMMVLKRPPSLFPLVSKLKDRPGA